MSTTIRTTAIRDVLAVIPYQLGFNPTGSLVAVSLRGPRRRIGLIARVDLLTADTTADTLAQHVRGDGADAALVIAYTDDHDHAHDATLFLADALTAAGITPAGTWWVTSTDYRAINPHNPRESDPTGRPLDLDSTVTAATMVSHGATIAPTRDALAVRPAGPDARTRANTARTSHSGEHNRAEALQAWRETLGGTQCTAEEAGRLAAALDDVIVRDAILCDLLPGGGTTADALTTGTSSGVGALLTTVLDPTTNARPEPAATANAKALLTHIAAHTDTAPALTLLGFLCWWEGNGAAANIHLAHALRLDPAYRLAHLISTALDAGMPPGWAATR